MKKGVFTLIAAFMALSLFAQNVDTTKRVAREKKPIKEFKVWKNGQQFDASDIDVICVLDDYASMARLYYEISDSLGVMVANGNIDITGADYVQYATKANHPDRAFAILLKTLRLEQRQLTAAQQAARKAAAAAAAAATTN